MNKLVMVALATALLSAPAFTEVADAATVTSEITHKIMRSDGSRARSDERHEFNGGSRLYFKSLGNKVFAKKLGLKGKLTPMQEGWSRLYLDWPTRLKSIVIRKASVGNGSFKKGHITFEVLNMRGKWITVFERTDHDIDTPVTIRDALRRVGPIKGVRLLLKSPLPITVGPIDLNG